VSLRRGSRRLELSHLIDSGTAETAPPKRRGPEKPVKRSNRLVMQRARRQYCATNEGHELREKIILGGRESPEVGEIGSQSPVCQCQTCRSCTGRLPRTQSTHQNRASSHAARHQPAHPSRWAFEKFLIAARSGRRLQFHVAFLIHTRPATG
jgi:hypothetical protein